MKTKGVKIGVAGDNGMNLCTDLDSIWTQRFTLLSTTYDVKNMENITAQNIEIKKKAILKTYYSMEWLNYHSSLQITLMKSFLISKITHILLSLPIPKEKTMNILYNVSRILYGMASRRNSGKIYLRPLINRTEMNLCTDLDLIWSQRFTSLGTTCEVQNMTKILR